MHNVSTFRAVRLDESGKKKVLYFTVEEIWGNYFSITVTFVNYSFEVSVTGVFLFLFIPQHAHAPQRSSVVQMDIASLFHGNVMGKMTAGMVLMNKAVPVSSL